ncbi:hypothetical protein F0261_17940 [Alteromonas sp. 07-89-2]|uniref:hypothetical protein n=1 Tax=unclassified Alteromonas TaxID=2614992 RepID=UPI00148CADCC|nr:MULTISPECIES: hypothetical protein [unclassified Alteromonas]MCG7639689.1 hypothetical protein [Alteromonas sp. CNT1-28]MCG7811619.1 hypothetical protein [Alteromonas sp. MCA-1]NOH59910.1 hypothetical protein [Alteromonas sp. 07-89-2]
MAQTNTNASAQNSNLYEGYEHIPSAERVLKNRDNIDGAYSSHLYELNGNNNRSVYGHLYKSEVSIFRKHSISNKDIDHRQKTLLSLMGDIASGRRESMTKVSEIEIPSIIGSNPLPYKHCPATTFGMEELLDIKNEHGGEVAHICMQLRKDVCQKAQLDKHEFNWLKGRIKRAFKRALGGEARGMVVLEISTPRRSLKDKLTSTKPQLHIHAIIYNSDGFDLKVRRRIRQSFKEMIANEHVNNAMIAQIRKRVNRINEYGPSYTSERITDIDLGIADYLCKELDKPIVKGCSNLGFFNMGNTVSIRHKWRYKQLQSLNAAASHLKSRAQFSTDIGDVDKTLDNAVKSVPRPPELVRLNQS